MRTAKLVVVSHGLNQPLLSQRNNSFRADMEEYRRFCMGSRWSVDRSVWAVSL
jgi:hypothetical protein